MRIAPVNNYQTRPNFAGESKKNNNKLKNAAGAAVVALAVAAPMQKADAQIYFRQPPVIPYTVVVPEPVITTVPDCFVLGDMNNFSYNKSMGQVFNELDADESGEISANEVIRAERNNWNLSNIYPYNNYQMNRDATEFNIVSKLYNEDNSNPNTMSYSEYRAAMNDYMKMKNVNTFINLMRLFVAPSYCPTPHYHVHPVVPPPPPHHHHRHW